MKLRAAILCIAGFVAGAGAAVAASRTSLALPQNTTLGKPITLAPTPPLVVVESSARVEPPDVEAIASSRTILAPKAKPVSDAPFISAFANRVVRFNQESRDPAWAPKATEELRSDLVGAARGLEAIVKTIDCRTTICEVTVQWRSHSEALEKSEALVARPMELNCDRFYDTPDDTNGTTTTLHFDCEGQRAAGL